MKALKEYIIKHQISKKLISEKLTITKDSEINSYNYFHKDRSELLNLIVKLIKERGTKANLNDIDTSKITDMSYLFNFTLNKTSLFNGDISKWDVSNVENMRNMFSGSQFNGDISKWDVSKVKNMCIMFNESKFNGDISNWNVSNVTDMGFMFYNSKFNGDISKWDVSNVENMHKMFIRCPLEKNPPKWYKK